MSTPLRWTTGPNSRVQVGNNLISNHINALTRIYVGRDCGVCKYRPQLKVTSGKQSYLKSHITQHIYQSLNHVHDSWSERVILTNRLFGIVNQSDTCMSHRYYIRHPFKISLSSSCSQPIRRSSLTKRVSPFLLSNQWWLL